MGIFTRMPRIARNCGHATSAGCSDAAECAVNMRYDASATNTRRDIDRPALTGPALTGPALTSGI
jgi:hypothetical protein